ncbi:NAD(P)-dependent oxidoreductase [Sphingomonas cavernae]|uniref:NAD(P)-dependent oxidoreductase n=1 Tax=Sphingomonas cavernae TaxID=2320861 RepID=A0A418WMD5_9SPHN|nr:NAD(P)-dependent oxidoreductase [Sphingomonas cavernae]RJF91169.1 NAD(P)-dependent oxidoreductase [Sphingomonas cavernae]
MKVGFIGLGSLGAPMARRIARSGFPLVVHDVSAAAMDAFDEPGVELVSDPVEVARRCEALCVCVRMDSDLVDLAGDGKIFAALGEGGLFIVHSTVAPELCQELAERAREHGVALVDAGVSGGGPAALKGELSIYAGGGDDALDKARPLLESLGKVAYLGPVGRGMQGKLLNNLVSIANYGMAAAILDLGESLGFDREQLRETLMAGSAQGFALRAVPGLLRPEGAVAMRQLLGKDVDHARKLADNATPAMAALVRAAESMLERLDRAAAEVK